jgi:hypothetical protein
MRTLLIAVALLSACSTAPKTPRQYFAATYTAISGAADSIAALAEGKKITPTDADQYLGKLDNAKVMVDAGKNIVVCRDAAKTDVEKDGCGSEDMAKAKVGIAEGLISEVKDIISKVRK